MTVTGVALTTLPPGTESEHPATTMTSALSRTRRATRPESIRLSAPLHAGVGGTPASPRTRVEGSGAPVGDGFEPLAHASMSASRSSIRGSSASDSSAEDALEERRRAVPHRTELVVAPVLGDHARSSSPETTPSTFTPRIRAISGREQGPR